MPKIPTATCRKDELHSEPPGGRNSSFNCDVALASLAVVLVNVKGRTRTKITEVKDSQMW